MLSKRELEVISIVLQNNKETHSTHEFANEDEFKNWVAEVSKLREKVLHLFFDMQVRENIKNITVEEE